MTHSPIERLRRAFFRREELRRRWDAARNVDMFGLLVFALPRLLDAERCGVFVSSESGDSVWLEAGTGVVERQIVVASDASMVGRVIASGDTLLRSSIAQGEVDTMVASRTGFVPRDALTVPVRTIQGRRVIGALQVLNKRNGKAFDAADISLLEETAFAVQASLQRIFEAQGLLAECERLDAEIRALDEAESAYRGDKRLRVFGPVLADEGGGFLHHRWRGKRYPPFISPEGTNALCESWDTDPDDIIIATHQKVGTHLTKRFLVELARDLCQLPDQHPLKSGDIGHDAVPWPEVLYAQHGRGRWNEHLARTAGHPRLWYTHCAYEDLPVRRIHPRTRFVVCVRDPRSVAVSQYHFWRRHPLLGLPADLTLDAFVERFVDGDLYFGDYHDHVLGWLRRTDGRVRADQVLVVRYEDLVEDKATSIDRLASFLSPGVSLTAEQREHIAHRTEFDVMKDEMTTNPQSFHLNPHVFFRSGKTRDWEDQLSAAAVHAIDQKTRRVWAGPDLSCPPDMP